MEGRNSRKNKKVNNQEFSSRLPPLPPSFLPSLPPFLPTYFWKYLAGL